jgi:hypothetical protein
MKDSLLTSKVRLRGNLNGSLFNFEGPVKRCQTSDSERGKKEGILGTSKMVGEAESFQRGCREKDRRSNI